jgi:hypothetical protein
MSAPARSARSWSPLLAPPYSVTTFAPAAGQNFKHSSPIWIASSRVGASTIAEGVTAAGRNRPSTISISGAAHAPFLTMRHNAGNKKPHVLPLPVLATATMSFPVKAIGQA